ncbi:MAG: hypothetical protein HRT87_06735 [Legionellales bacterium]|nr:hypothetical protein [Legionellales bacterium]
MDKKIYDLSLDELSTMMQLLTSKNFEDFGMGYNLLKYHFNQNTSDVVEIALSSLMVKLIPKRSSRCIAIMYLRPDLSDKKVLKNVTLKTFEKNFDTQDSLQLYVDSFNSNFLIYSYEAENYNLSKIREIIKAYVLSTPKSELLKFYEKALIHLINDIKGYDESRR